MRETPSSLNTGVFGSAHAKANLVRAVVHLAYREISFDSRAGPGLIQNRANGFGGCLGARRQCPLHGPPRRAMRGKLKGGMLTAEKLCAFVKWICAGNCEVRLMAELIEP
jgi:hypothetical protein